ncbi:MAG TPA: aminoacetone oxidase family FAD-binding enzyme, partial [Anaerolineaceae bacterium]|nr:aminoacetone oxidase family FAD-binding enzyme [Anaerolineaceae bacterium]
ILESRLVLLATGGERQGFELATALGHRIVPPVPSLFTFHVADPRLAGLAGLSVPDAHVALPEWNLAQCGPVLITHWGVSGPAVIRLSAWAARALAEAGYRARLRINWLPALAADDLVRRLQAERSAHPQRQLAAHDPIGLLPARLWRRLVESCTPDSLTWAGASNRQLVQLVETLTRGEYRLAGKSKFKEEFVTAGGVALEEVDFRTMQSRVQPGLYLAGEALDVDGLTGGFNFQNAWTTGWIAAQACAASLARSGSESG